MAPLVIIIWQMATRGVAGRGIVGREGRGPTGLSHEPVDDEDDSGDKEAGAQENPTAKSEYKGWDETGLGPTYQW